ncbi:Cleavage and polyadenylation specificity factor subunit like [Quillaja saponaria]|uniref:Cleavage and polyadenylation specificity factor subunit like n=1 Tax=Quillaja saponaria TaxID=32244 RepID=A0AAD7LHV9_QUISA|nr:Cleavage and polyadenylation specificity factor subunit like [Quillaja saponaria]
MDTVAEEQLDFDEDEYGGAQKLQYQGGGAIPALADAEMMGEDDDYDDLYNDVNVGEGFLQLHQSEVPPPPGGVSNGGLQTLKTEAPESGLEPGGSKELNMPGVSAEGKYPNTGSHFSEKKEGMTAFKGSEMESVGFSDSVSVTQKGRVMEVTHESHVRNMGFQGSTSMPPNPSGLPQRASIEPVPLLNSGTSAPQGIPQMPSNQMTVNMSANRQVVDEIQIQAPLENGSTVLFVGDLHWWTTDAELETVLMQYGRMKEIKFFDERASGKSKGYCQVEFYDATAAAACKDGMNGYVFNGRACVVAFASPQTLKQMGASYMNKNQVQTQPQPQSQPQSQGRRPMNEGSGRGGTMNYQGGDAGRNYGRGGWGRGGHGGFTKGPGGGGMMRGRGAGMGPKGMVGNIAGVGGGYGQGLGGPPFGGPAGSMMNPQGMMGSGFDPTFMVRGGGYGGFPGPAFPGMLPSFSAVNAMGFAGVAPHVNPAFFGRGMPANGMGMMGSTGMDVHQAGMWNDTAMGGWGGEEHGRRTRESSYGGDDGASEYGYGEANQEKGPRSSAASREKERGSELSGKSERRHHDEREQEWDRLDRDHRDHRHREEKDNYRDHRQRERDSGYEDDWDRGQSSSRPRSRPRVMPDEDRGSRSRDADYGRKRRLPSEVWPLQQEDVEWAILWFS